MFRPLGPPPLDSGLSSHSGNAWSHARHGSQVHFSAFSLCSARTFTCFSSSAFSPTQWAMLIRNIFAFSLAQREHLHVPWGHLVRLYCWIKLLSFFSWWIPSHSHQVWDLITLSIYRFCCNFALLYLPCRITAMTMTLLWVRLETWQRSGGQSGRWSAGEVSQFMGFRGFTGLASRFDIDVVCR